MQVSFVCRVQELQRKVRMRLSLDAATLPAFHPPSARRHRRDAFPFLSPRRARRAQAAVGSVGELAHPDTAAPASISPASPHSSSLASTTRRPLPLLSHSDAGRNRKRFQPASSSTAVPDGTEKTRRREEERTGPKETQTEMTLFQYLHAKYGTPVEQLEQLAKGGSFKTNSSDELTPGGHRIFWPVEAHISQPTPRHCRHELHGFPARSPLHQSKKGAKLQYCIYNNKNIMCDAFACMSCNYYSIAIL